MTAHAQEILRAARALPPHEQLSVLEGLAQSLAQAFSPLGQATAEFWQWRSLQEVASARRIPVIADIAALVMPDWPREESVDDLLRYIQDQRRQDIQER